MSNKARENVADSAKKRYRRTKKDIEQSLFDAAITLIENIGFNNLTVKALSQEAKIDPPVFYNRYKDMNDFLEKFVRNYDYWLNDNIKFNQDNLHPVVNAYTTINAIAESLLNDICMQKLIAWEINEKNYIPQRTAQNRDISSKYIMNFFDERFKNCEINFSHASSLIIGGIIFLILHRGAGTFNSIDYTEQKNIAELKSSIEKIILRIFDDYEEETPSVDVPPSKQQAVSIAKKLIKNNVEYDIIKVSTGLGDNILEKLYKNY